MSMIDEDKIRARAYELWEREGRPAGREHDHWEQAKWELLGEAARKGNGSGGRVVAESGSLTSAHGDVPHAGVDDAKAGNATTATGIRADVNDAIPGKAPKRGGRKAAAKTAATAPEPPKSVKPIRKSSARRGDEALTTPATEGQIKRAIKKPKT